MNWVIWAAVSANLTALAIHIWSIQRNQKAIRRYEKAAAEMETWKHGMPPELVDKMNSTVFMQIGLRVELMEQIERDLMFLMEQKYPCDATLGEVRKWIAILKSCRIQIETKGEGHV